MLSEVGHKFNMIDLNASIGIAQLKKINKHWRDRKNYSKFTKMN